MKQRICNYTSIPDLHFFSCLVPWSQQVFHTERHWLLLNITLSHNISNNTTSTISFSAVESYKQVHFCFCDIPFWSGTLNIVFDYGCDVDPDGLSISNVSPPFWSCGKASASRPADLGLSHTFTMDFFPGRVHASDLKYRYSNGDPARHLTL